MSYAAAVADFIGAMEAAGIQPAEPIAQRLSGGELIRFRCEGDGRGRQNGWAKLYLDERPAGAFGNYRVGISSKWSVERDVTLSAEERRRLQAEWSAAAQRRSEERALCAAEAARDALDMWAAAGPASPSHPYVVRKGLDVAGLRQTANGRLLVPMYDALGALWNLQRIDADGTKRFIKGGRTEGLFFILGCFSRQGETACIGEGFSTMSAIHRASGYPSIAAFSAKNLLAVARLWHAARPDLDIIICGDNDAHLIDHPQVKKNLGMEIARAAADEIGARLAMPLGRAA